MRDLLELFYEDSDKVCFVVDYDLSGNRKDLGFLFGVENGLGEFEEMFLSTAAAEALYDFLGKNLNLKLDND